MKSNGGYKSLSSIEEHHHHREGTNGSDSGKKTQDRRVDRRRSRAGIDVPRVTNGQVTYQIGSEIGRGYTGVVFQALNTENGDFVAIKRVGLHDIDNDSLAAIKLEIDLLKKLNHVNIVKYIDTIQTENHLHIVLEIMEASLAGMCKKYGTFSETLTAVYMTQTLEGLRYLHDQGVLHRDIKGANLLTTKDGRLKLADFGVAKLTGSKTDPQETDIDVVGTPYWMAPEIIEMSGTTAACDIWSVGCTIIELLTGKPPYYDLPQMSALYKIVQDDHPPLPDCISAALRDFLLNCFLKEPRFRKSAAELLSHPWLKSLKSQLRANNQNLNSVNNGNINVNNMNMQSSSNVGDGGLERVRVEAQRHLNTEDEDYKYKYQDDAPPLLQPLTPVSSPKLYNSNSKFTTPTQNATKVSTVSQDATHTSTLIQRENNENSMVHVQPKHQEKDEDMSDLTFDFDTPAATTRKFATGSVSPVPQGIETVQIQCDLDEWMDDDDTNTPENTNIGKKTLPLVLSTKLVPQSTTEALSKTQPGVAIIGHEATLLSKFRETNESDTLSDMDGFGDEGTNMNIQLLSLDFNVENTTMPITTTDRGQETVMAVVTNNINISDEDPFGANFDTDINNDENAAERERERAERDRHQKVGRDVYAELQKLAESVQNSSAGNINQYDMILSFNDLIEQLTSCPEARFYVVSGDSCAVPIIQLTDIKMKKALPYAIQLINKIIVDNPRACERLSLIGIVPKIISLMPSLAQTLLSNEANASTSAVMATPKYTKHPGGSNDEDDGGVSYIPENDVRSGMMLALEVATFVGLTSSSNELTCQMLIGCGGLVVIVELLRASDRFCAGDSEAHKFVKIGVDSILRVFSLQGVRRNDIYIMLLRLGLLPYVMEAFSQLLHRAEALASAGECIDEKSTDISVPYLEKSAQILLHLSKSDTVARDMMATDECLRGLMAALNTIFPSYPTVPLYGRLAVALLTVVKNLTMESSTLDKLAAHGAFTTLVPMLQKKGNSAHDKDIEAQVLQCMLYLCQISRKRQEKAALAGLVPHLQRHINEASQFQQIAFQIVCDLAHASSTVRDILWDQNCLELYIKIIRSASDTKWNVTTCSTTLRSISAWLLNDTERVETRLVQPDMLPVIVTLFCTAQQTEFEKVVEELQAMIQKSTTLAKALGVSDLFVRELMKRLIYPKAIVCKMLLVVLRTIYKNHSAKKELNNKFNLYACAVTLASNKAQILVSEIATQLLEEMDAE